ncbi:MAG TPA: methyltransferase domain-containing protein [Bryobacteraceae bacterium]|nr:methyltransferase domain-containing protein [Bryobacteraceae bacterium]
MRSTDTAVFMREALRFPVSTASVVPSSGRLSEALIRPIDFGRARTIVELGPGTGPVTRHLLGRLHPAARIIAIEMNAVFASRLPDGIGDKRLTVVHGRAERMRDTLSRLSVSRVDAVVSSLGFTVMSERQRTVILDQIREALVEDGVFSQFQYLTSLLRFDARRLLEARFRSVSHSLVMRNLPPACVSVCRRPN